MAQRLDNIGSIITNNNRVAELRKNSKLNKDELFNTIYPSKISRYFPEIYKLIRDYPSIFQHQDIEEHSRTEIRKLGTQQLMKILTVLKIDLEKEPYKFVSALYTLSFFNLGTSIKGLVHYLLYIKSILIFQSNSYHKKCLVNKNFEDIGSFSLTELYHGSYSQGIGTIAVYEHSTKQFVINTNGEEGMKFWIGNLAQGANKTILWAQLIVNGVNYGPHPFLMQVRDLKTHEVLKGLTIGDCGPKNGLNIIDNGYMMIKDARIPVDTLLGKLGSIDENGKYQSVVKNNSQRFGLHMSPLSFGRAGLVTGSLTQASAALAIGLRFSYHRRQFKTTNESTSENIIIDYPIIRHRLILPLATDIIYHFAGIKINELYVENSENFTDPTKVLISELHAISAVLKVKASWFANTTITECRELLAGHGYSSFSRLGSYYNDNDINATWEGDNNMLLQQTSKYLLKTLGHKKNTEIIDLSFVYEGVQKLEITEEALNNTENLRILLRNVFISKYNTATKELSRLREEASKVSNSTKEEVEVYVKNRLQPFFANELALSYGDLLFFEVGYQTFQNLKGHDHNKTFLDICLKTWAQNVLLKASIEDIECRKLLQKLIVDGCEQIYPDSISAIDVLTPPSFMIGSPFAQEDGEGMKAYINMLFTAKKTFGRVPWFDRLVKLREENEEK